MLVEQPSSPKRGRPPRPAELDRALLPRLGNLAALRVVLTGESVVDLPRLWFVDRDAVDEFLRLCAFDTDNPLDVAALHELHHDAIAYLTDAHNYRLPPQVKEPGSIHDLFLLPSTAPARVRRFACMVLKVMHIMQHVDGHELVFNTAISEAQLLDRLSAKVFGVIDQMRASGIGVTEFAAGKKSRSSLVTKLLAKRSTLASHIFDKLRFRVIVSSREDLVSTLLYMVRHLFPFNYVVPDQSQNGIVSAEDIARVLDLPLGWVNEYWNSSASGRSESFSDMENEFSGKTYRSVNFVADIPVRIDDVAPEAAPAIVFVQTEIQVIDAETEKHNSRGDNNHALYKKRQRLRVRRRLEGSKAEASISTWRKAHAGRGDTDG